MDRREAMLSLRSKLLAEHPHLQTAGDLAPLMGDFENEYWEWVLDKMAAELEPQMDAMAQAAEPLFTLPGWTRAHLLEEAGSLGAIRLWETACAREYRLPDPEFDDEPIEAPKDMPMCADCRQVQRALSPPSSVDEGNTPDE